VWTAAEFAKAFETELADQLQPYQRDMEAFVPFA
jgi:hypothetical protein